MIPQGSETPESACGCIKLAEDMRQFRGRCPGGQVLVGIPQGRALCSACGGRVTSPAARRAQYPP